jgi:hypothetical protein
MTGDHQGRTSEEATLQVRAADEILGTHRAHDPVTGRPVYVSDRLPVLQFGLFSDRRVLLISVFDQFADPPVRKNATADDESGRGLMMVGRISASLDWHPVQGGKVVRAFLQAA